MPVNRCAACLIEFNASRKDRRWCTLACKQELKRSYDRERYPEIAAQTIERACEWQRQNARRKSDYDARYRLRNLERLRAQKREYGRLHPSASEERRLASGRRRARKLRNGSYRVTARDLRRLHWRLGGRCAYCLEPVAWDAIEWDHIVPISRGGSHSVGNLAPACRECNRNKAWKTLLEWRLGRVVSQFSLRAVTPGLAH